MRFHQRPTYVLFVFQFQEFHHYAKSVGPSEETPRIKDCINWFNGLSLWTQSSILRQRASVSKRAKTLIKFIDVVKELCDLNSLNTALSVIGGLQAAPIKRLVATWAELPKGKAEVLPPRTYSETSLIRHLYNPTFSLFQPLYEVQSPYVSMVRGTP